MQVVYVDVLFLINFCMDLLALRTVGLMLHLPSSRGALLLSSVLGGIYAVVSALTPGYPLVSTAVGGAVAVLLCYTAYGRECAKPRFFGLVSLFFIISWLLGGMITAFYEFLGSFFEKQEELHAALLEGDGKIAVFFFLVSLAALLLGVGERQLRHRRHTASAPLTICEAGKRKTVTAMVDTGNTLCDPLTGKLCIVLVTEAAEAVIPRDILNFSKKESLDTSMLGDEGRRRIRLIPTESLGGRRLLVGYSPKRLLLYEGTEKERGVDAVLVLDPHRNDYNGYEALLPAALIS